MITPGYWVHTSLPLFYEVSSDTNMASLRPKICYKQKFWTLH